MNQNIWGPHLWFSLHTISFTYPLNPTENDKQHYKNFFTNLQDVIPCSVCKKNYKRHIIEHPIDDFLNTRKTLVYWVIDMHNMVNGEIGKKILSYDTVIKKYEEVYKKKIILKKNGTDDEIDNIVTRAINKVDYVKIVYGLFTLFIILLLINLLYTIIKKRQKL